MENYSGSFSVLVVEDNPGDVELTREAFKQCFAEVHIQVASSAMEALHLLRSNVNVLPDLILLDLNLPGWGGKSLLKEIKSDGRLRKIPVIVLSNSSASDDVVESYSLNANCYIVKPLDIDIFFEKIKQIEAFWFHTALLPGTV